MRLRNRATQNDFTLRATNWKRFMEILFFPVANSTLQNVKLNFELLTRSRNFYLFYFRVTNSKVKCKKLHFELLTRNQKIKCYTLSY